MDKRNGKPIRAYIVDDHEVVRAGLRTILESAHEIAVIGEAGAGTEAIEDVIRFRPDVVLMDVRLRQGNGIQACRDIRKICRETRVLMLSAFTEEGLVLDAVLAGAHGYLSKFASRAALISAVRAIAAGRTVFERTAASRVTEMRPVQTVKPRTGPESLTAQEQRVLTLVAEGKTNKEVAAALDLSEKTVKNYLANIYDKLNISRRAQAAALYARGMSTVHHYSVRMH
ncbi:MAG TPA: response regulator transcription factor [Nitrospiraceae bacterium]|jgi:DNA-binding NarL/FixJ family response regulator|nr:response regulator transcription factor [Nitrospiraceae bacterium]